MCCRNQMRALKDREKDRANGSATKRYLRTYVKMQFYFNLD